ncbi:hypothetical protein KMP13_11720 [Epibacterium ulvae]|uniref:hypothetical protein n=1 Tax=Epibacterium ulvae TaxID=1156985 RepID=UPI001BFC7CB6|nr:hypothetical protein [Epibacterium ulvae]MBT8154555.1 hypothetical protein [Epibacterium ulvae]
MTRRSLNRSRPQTAWTALFAPSLFVLPLFALTVTPAARAQDAQNSAPLPRYSYELSQSLRVSDNIRLNRNSLGTTTAAETNARASYRFEDGLQNLALEAGGVFRVVDDPVLGSDQDLSDADLRLNYLRESANARLALQSSYVRRDLSFDDALNNDGLTDQDFSTSAGRRDDINTQFRFDTGLSDPLGLNVTLIQRNRRFNETNDPDLFDTDTTSARIGAVFRFGQTTEAELSLFQSRFESENAARTERDTQQLVLGLTHAFSAITTLQLDLGYAEVDERFTALPDNLDRNSGVIGTLAVTRARRNGEVSARLATNVTQAGRRNTFEIARRFVLPTGVLAFSLGAVDGTTTNPRAIGSVDYRLNWVRSSFRAQLRRTGSVSDTTSVVTETTRLTLGYDYELNPLTNLSLDLRHASIHETGLNTDPDRSRSSVDLTLTRDLGNEWDLVTGYQFRRSDRDDTGSAHSNTLFFTLNREFGAPN